MITKTTLRMCNDTLRTRSGRSPLEEFHSYSTLHSFDVRTELAQLLIEMFVAAIDMINAADFSLAFGFQSSQHKRRGSPKVARHHRRAEEFFHPLDDSGCA